MSKNFQKTISKPLEFEGVGLHTGVKSKIKIRPASENTGVVFERIDVKKNNLILANFKNVSSSVLCTKITNSKNVSVSTVEHLLASFYITGIDNVIVEIDNIEVPIMDGSSKDFVEGIYNTGIDEQTVVKNTFNIEKKIDLKIDNKFISLEPNDNGLVVDFKLNYKNDIIGNQRNVINFNDKELKDVYTSRTFCLFEDIEKIKKLGFAKGGSLDNAIVVKENEILNIGGLRNKLEFVNHKILDLVGDFLLSGYRINGKVTTIEGGHNLSISFLQKLFNEIIIKKEVFVKPIKNSKNIIQKVPNQLAVNS